MYGTLNEPFCPARYKVLGHMHAGDIYMVIHSWSMIGLIIGFIGYTTKSGRVSSQIFSVVVLVFL